MDFADKLAISINHLNKAVKTYIKTTTEVITERNYAGSYGFIKSDQLVGF